MSKCYKIAACISGDFNVLYSGIVTLVSTKRYNPDFELFIIQNGPITPQIQELCAKYDITLLTFSEEMENYLKDIRDRTLSSRSTAVFSKFYCPYIFKKMNYDYLINLDHDILCWGSYDQNEFLPQETPFAFRPSRPLGIRLSHKILCYFSNRYNIDINNLKNHFYPAFGCFICNLQNYDYNNFLYEIKIIINLLDDLQCRFNSDEIAFGLYDIIFKTKSRYLPLKYNFSNLFWQSIPNDLINEHFYWHKPWNILDNIDTIDTNNKIDYKNYLLRMLQYIKYINNFEFRDKLIKNKNILNILKEKIYS